MRPALFEIDENESSEKQIVIRDAGDHAICSTVTNDAERVVAKLYGMGRLLPGQKLLYYDSEGELTQLLWFREGYFGGYASPEA